nr:unnamed protein product [Digitaria exilis]
MVVGGAVVGVFTGRKTSWGRKGRRKEMTFGPHAVPLQNGGSLVIEQTEALVSIDVNGGHSMFGQGTSQEKAILEVNLEAAKQVCDVSSNFRGK